MSVNEQALQELYDVLETRGGKEYALGFLYSMILTLMEQDPRMRELVGISTANVRQFEREYKLK